MCESLSNSNSNSSYHLCEELGRGRFGVIFHCFSTATNAFFAAKSIDKTALTDPIDRNCLENEPKIMSLLSPHPNIVQIHDVFDSDEALTIIMDLCQPYTLYDVVLKSNGGLSEPEAAMIIKQILSALAHCHKFGVVHRDLKPENILFDENNTAKLADFGNAEWIGPANGIVGTPYYVAPEVVMGREYDEKIDVWSAGVVLYVMLAGIPPFYGDSVEEIFEAVVRGNLRFPPKIFRNVSPAAKDLLRKMICRDPSRRISAEQALWHPWILSRGEANSMD